MKTQIKTLAIAAAAVLVGAAGWSALADTPAPAMPGNMSMHGPGSTGMGTGMMGGIFSDPVAYLASLKEKLGITEAQTPAWDVYAKAVQDTFVLLKTTHDSADMTAFHDKYQQGFQTLRAAAHQFAETLPDRQAQLAAQVLPGLASGGHGMMGQGGMMGGNGMMGMMGGRGMGMMGGIGQGANSPGSTQ